MGTPNFSDIAHQQLVRRFSADPERYFIDRGVINPRVSIWRELSRFIGREAIRARFTNDTDLIVERTDSIQRAIRFARAYYDALEDADPLIEPVLLYYGSLWLSIALIQMRAPDELVLAYKPAHGVRPALPRSEDDSPLRCTIVSILKNGNLPSLIATLGGDQPANDRGFSLYELMRAVPDLAYSYDIEERHQSRYESNTSGIHPRVEFGPTEQDRNKFFVGLMPWEAMPERYGGSIHEWGSWLVTMPFFEKMPDFELRKRGFVCSPELGDFEIRSLLLSTTDGYFFESRFGRRPIEEDEDADVAGEPGPYLPEICVHLMIQHALSEFARYTPEYWLQISDQYTNDYALIREFLDASTFKFPVLVLNELAGLNFQLRYA